VAHLGVCPLPEGRPTAFPHAVSVVVRVAVPSSSKIGVCASDTALPGRSQRAPSRPEPPARMIGAGDSVPPTPRRAASPRSDRVHQLARDDAANPRGRGWRRDQRTVRRPGNARISRVLRLDTAAVKDPYELRLLWRAVLRSGRRMNAAAPVPARARRPYGADCPDRLVCDRDLGEPLAWDLGQRLLNLMAELALGVPVLAFCVRLTDAEQRQQARVDAAGTLSAAPCRSRRNSSRRSEWPRSRRARPARSASCRDLARVGARRRLGASSARRPGRAIRASSRSSASAP